jgi:hypothetical protein
MTLGQQGNQYLFNGLVLPGDYFAQFISDVSDSRGDVF